MQTADCNNTGENTIHLEKLGRQGGILTEDRKGKVSLVKEQLQGRPTDNKITISLPPALVSHQHSGVGLTGWWGRENHDGQVQLNKGPMPLGASNRLWILANED